MSNVDSRAETTEAHMNLREGEGKIEGTDWSKLLDEEGNLYYSHAGTGETQWDMPAEVAALKGDIASEPPAAAETAAAVATADAPQASPAKAKRRMKLQRTATKAHMNLREGEGKIEGTDWMQLLDEEGNPYYSHSKTDETQWVMPAEVAALHDEDSSVANPLASEPSGPPPGLDPAEPDTEDSIVTESERTVALERALRIHEFSGHWAIMLKIPWYQVSNYLFVLAIIPYIIAYTLL